MKRKITSLLLLSVLLIASTGCGDKETVLATVNGREVTQKQFDAYLELKRIPAKDEKRRAAALEEYLQREALAAVIEQQGKIDASIVDAEVNEFRKQMLISRYFDELLADSVTSSAIQNKYKSEVKEFETKKVHAAHILIRTNKRMSEEQRQAKFTTAQEVYSKLQTGGDFEALAREYSEDKISGSRGGDLGWIKEGTIDERFTKRAFDTKAGKFTEPFETPFGYHILKVLEEPKTIRRPLAAVSGEIRYELRGETKSKEMERLEALVAVTKKSPYVLDEKKNVGEGKPRQDLALKGQEGGDDASEPHKEPSPRPNPAPNGAAADPDATSSDEAAPEVPPRAPAVPTQPAPPAQPPAQPPATGKAPAPSPAVPAAPPPSPVVTPPTAPANPETP